MLDPWIIEEIRRREQERREQREQPALDIHPDPAPAAPERNGKERRGVVVVELL